MDYKQVFRRLGLSKNAASVYEVLLTKKHGMLASHIAKEANISRTEFYRILGPCMKAGLIRRLRSIQGARTLYRAEHPRRIRFALLQTAHEVDKTLRSGIQEKEKEYPAKLEYFNGPLGIRRVFDDVVERMPKKGTFYRYTSERNVEKVNQYLSRNYRALRDSKKLERLVISNPISGKTKRPRLERFIKFFPPEVDLFDQNIIQLVYADSLAFINLNTMDSYIIRDADMAKFQTVIFRQLYKKLS